MDQYGFKMRKIGAVDLEILVAELVAKRELAAESARRIGDACGWFRVRGRFASRQRLDLDFDLVACGRRAAGLFLSLRFLTPNTYPLIQKRENTRVVVDVINPGECGHNQVEAPDERESKQVEEFVCKLLRVFFNSFFTLFAEKPFGNT